MGNAGVNAAFLLSLLGCGGAMPIHVTSGMTFVFVGDSLTAGGWYDADQPGSEGVGTDLLMQQLEAPVGSKYVHIPPLTSHPTPISKSNTRALTVVNSGVGGDEISDIEDDIPGRITDYNPDVVVIQVGINDCVISQTALATFRASYDNVLATVKATLPNVQIVCVSLLVYRELWESSPAPAHFAGNQFDTGALSIPNYNAQIEASAAAHGAYYVDVRAPAALADVTLNAPEPGEIFGGVTGDGLHPTAAGQMVMSDAARAVFVVQ